MTRPWQTIASVPTPEGALELRCRGDEGPGADYLIVVGGRVLMTSSARRSEEELAERAVAALPAKARAAPRVLVGGLGMAFTLRAALDALPAAARVTVVELNPDVVAWCRGPLAPATNAAVADPRVTVVVADVARAIADAAPGAFDAIVLDLYEGPNAATQEANDPFYGAAALGRARAALAPGGVLAVWSEDPDAAFERRFGGAGFAVTTHRSGRGGRTHVVYLGVRTGTR
jgi:spermidine synthase